MSATVGIELAGVVSSGGSVKISRFTGAASGSSGEEGVVCASGGKLPSGSDRVQAGWGSSLGAAPSSAGIVNGKAGSKGAPGWLVKSAE